MVLKKVGEFLTTIKVNGQEKVSTLQSEDNVYEITDSQNVTLLLNGEPVDNFNQTSDSTYDIQASASNDNFEEVTLTWSSPGARSTTGSVSSSLTIPDSLDGFTGSVRSGGSFDTDIFSNDTPIASTDNDANFTGTFNGGDTFSCRYEGQGDTRARISFLQVSINIPVNPSASPDGATKS